jgi:hypothetical protein
MLSIRGQDKYRDVEAVLITAERKEPQIYFLAKNRN